MATIQPIGDLSLECGRTLKAVQVAYETRGILSPQNDNVVLVLHGFSSGPDTILPGGETAEGSWCELIGPGKAIDTDRYHVICPNALGSTYGTTGAASIDPDTHKPYGSQFPALTLRDIVASQRALLDRLGIDRVIAAVGPSFGGMQALQWGVAYPDAVRGVVAALTSLGDVPANAERLRAALATDPHWNGGDYYDHGPLVETLSAMRVQMLNGYGVPEALAKTIDDSDERNRIIDRRAKAWAAHFDANALITIMTAMATFDVTAQLDAVTARVLYVLSRTDPIFPPSLAEPTMAAFAKAGVDADYVEIDSEAGHSASSSDWQAWAPVLRQFMESMG